MIVINSKDTVIPTPEEAAAILKRNTDRVGIPINYDRLLEYYSFYTIRGNQRKRRVSKYIGTREGEMVTPTGFANWLEKQGVREGLLLTPKGLKSMSRKSLESAIATGLYSKELCNVMTVYMDGASDLKIVDTFGKIIENHVPSVLLSWDNNRIIFVKPKWVIQNTGRIGMADPSIMTIARACMDILTVPKGWIEMEVDSGQIEPRIIQSTIVNDPQLKRCTMLYNDAYYGYVHYCILLTAEQRRSGTLDFQPIEVTPEMEEKRARFKTFGNAVMYGSTENVANDTDKAAFIKYIGGHPKRVAIQADIEENIRRGERVFYTQFGTPINIMSGSSEDEYEDKGSDAYFNHLVRCAINNPVQGTAADLMRISIRKADRLLMKHAPNSFIMKYTHDSGTFAINEKDAPKVEDELKGIVSYQVDDWIPIYGKESDCKKLTSDLPRLI